MKKITILTFLAFLLIACAEKKTEETSTTPAPVESTEPAAEEEMVEEEAEEVAAPSPIIDGINAGKIFKTSCAVCHGADGKLGANGAKDLTVSTFTLEQRIENITNGKGLMTPFGSILKPEEIQAVAKYTMQLKP